VATTPSTPPGPPRAQLPPLFTKREKYALTILSATGIIISGMIHFAIGTAGESLMPHFAREATPPPQKVTVQTLIKPPPKPTPTPPPTPTPTPPPPVKNTPPPVNLKLHVVQSHSSDQSGTGPVEQAYTPPPTGSENGIPTAVPTVVPTTAPTEVPTPSGPVAITDSEIIHKVTPEYPQLAQDEQIQGDVTVRVTIGPQGQVVNAIIASSSGNPLLDQSALKAARQTTYKPPMANGVPTTQDYLVVYNFRLDQ
jgi:protein TonB